MNSQPAGKLLLDWAEENQSRFGEGYYERGEGSCYINYSWKPELITPYIKGIIQRSGIKNNSKILDFGCAKGFYVKVLAQMGYDPVGVDISEYALSQSPQDIKDRLFLLNEYPLELLAPQHFNLTIAKDVLEHMPEFALCYLISQLKLVSEKLFVMVPVCDENRNYINASDERDFTHQIRYTADEWEKLFESCVSEDELCRIIKHDKSKGTLCCFIACDNLH